MDPMQKMWASFVAIGLMVLSALIVSWARAKTRGWIRAVITIVAFLMLLIGVIFAFFSIV